MNSDWYRLRLFDVNVRAKILRFPNIGRGITKIPGDSEGQNSFPIFFRGLSSDDTNLPIILQTSTRKFPHKIED